MKTVKNTTQILAFAYLTLLLLAGCGGLRMGVGLKGVMLDDKQMTLGGDTFDIWERIGDSLLIVWNKAEASPYYLLKNESNGFYYPLIKAKSIFSIDSTTNYVSINDKSVYDIKNKKVLFSPPCSAFGLYYLGKWNDLHLFASFCFDTICFSDGKCIGLQDDAFFLKSKKDGMVTLVAGAQTMDVSFNDLYHTKKVERTKDESIVNLVRDYHIKPKNKYETMDAGFCVNLEIPKSDTDADKTIRKWMLAAIKDDAFYQLKYNKDVPDGSSASVREMTNSLDGYGVLWEKLCRAEYQIKDTLEVRMTCNIEVKKIADCDDYATYYYRASLYNGGAHDLPHEYYITYDKRRGELLNADNSVKPGMQKQFRHLTLESLKKVYDSIYERESSWEDFTSSIFAFHCPLIDTSGMDDIMLSFLEHNYSCDEWAGWNGYNKSFTETDFPLTHFAVLPEGIVLTYHPYQIDCFAAGEYHAVIPFKDANKCLMLDYSRHEDLKPKLQRFIK